MSACTWPTAGSLGYDRDEATPDHSVLSKARARCGVTVYQAFFTEIVRQCAPAGHIRGDRLYVDSTPTAANASLESMGARALVAQLAGVAGGAGVDDHLAAVSSRRWWVLRSAGTWGHGGAVSRAQLPAT